MAITTRSPAPRPAIFRFGWLSWAIHHLLSLETVLVLFLYGRHLKGILPATPVPETLFYGALSVAIGSWLILRDGIYKRGLPIVVAGLLFTAWVVISYGWSPSTLVARESIVFILVINLWALLIGACVVARSRERIMRFLLLLVFLASIVSLDGIYINFVYGDFRFYRYGEEGWHQRTYLAWANIVATGMAIALAIAAHVRFGSFRQLLAIGILGAGFFFVLISGARGATLAIIVAGFLALAVDMPRIRDGRIEIAKTQLFLAALVIVLLGYVAYLLATGQSTHTLDRLLSLFAEADDPLLRDGPNRFDTLAGAYRAWLDAPWLGQGLAGSFDFVCGREINPCYPHNAILQVMADLGLVGLLLFLAFLFTGIRHLGLARLRRDPLQFTLAMAFVTVIFHLMVASDTITYYPLFFFLGLLAMPPPSPETDDDD